MKKIIAYIFLANSYLLCNAQSVSHTSSQIVYSNINKRIGELQNNKSFYYIMTDNDNSNCEKNSRITRRLTKTKKSETRANVFIGKKRNEKLLAGSKTTRSGGIVVVKSNSCKNSSYTYYSSDTKQFEGDMFDKLSEIKGVQVVYISKSLLGNMPKMAMPGVNIGKMASKLEGIQIFTVEQNASMKMLKYEVKKLVKNRNYETIMFVKDDTSKTAFYQKKLDKKRSEMLMVTEEKEEVVVIRFIGTFTVNDIQEIAKRTVK